MPKDEPDLKTRGDGTGEGASPEQRMRDRATRKEARGFGRKVEAQFEGEVLSTEENKVIEYFLSLKGNGVNPSCYHIIKGAALTREEGMAAIEGLVALGLIGSYVSGRGATVYCKCGELLS